jgi:hypothetical protein
LKEGEGNLSANQSLGGTFSLTDAHLVYLVLASLLKLMQSLTQIAFLITKPSDSFEFSVLQMYQAAMQATAQNIYWLFT